MATKTFRELTVWQKAHEFVLQIYRLTTRFPKEELFGLTSQLRRAAISIAANIAEGYKRLGHADKLRFYNISQGSIEECQYYLILAADLRYCDSQSATTLLDQVSRLRERYMQGLRNRPPNY